MVRILFFLVLLSFGQSLLSQTCCSGGVPLSNNLGLPNEGKGIWLLGLNYDYNNLNTLNAGSDKLNDDSRKRVTNSILFNLGYSFTDNFSAEVLFTWVNQTRTITQFGNEDFTETKGVGDAVILAKYAIPDILGQRTVLNFGLGTKLPLGKSDVSTDQGIQLTADLQPGSGAWDALGWLSLSKGLGFRPSAMLSGSFTYRLTGKNNSYLGTSTYEFGDEVQVNFGYTDQFLLFNTIFVPGLLLKYRESSFDKIDDLDLPNTGGQWVFVRPELTVQLTPSFALSAKLEIPIYSYVDGTQLTPTFRFSFGAYLKMNSKKANILN